VSSEESEREYQAIVWKDDPDSPPQRTTVRARTLVEAREMVEARFGPGCRISLWNEEDAARPR
jgi:hypothetical protein